MGNIMHGADVNQSVGEPDHGREDDPRAERFAAIEDGNGGGNNHVRGGNAGDKPSIRPEFTAVSSSVYVFDDVPVVLTRSDGQGYSHSIEKHAPWSNNDSKFSSSLDMFDIKKIFIEENSPALRALKSQIDAGENVSNRCSATVSYGGDNYRCVFEYRNDKFHEVTAYKLR